MYSFSPKGTLEGREGAVKHIMLIPSIQKNKGKRGKYTTAGVRLNLGEPEFEMLWSEEIHLWVCDLV